MSEYFKLQTQYCGINATEAEIFSISSAAKEYLKQMQVKLYIYIKISATLIFIIVRNEARANPAKPLRLLLRIALAFLPFGQKRKALPVMLFILLIRFYCARYSVGGVDSPPKLPDIISHIKPLSENTCKIMISSDTHS
ncbi:TPA: hypothetical protein L9L98_002149 [Klebsiella pneumoniae]|nr:hypothetical protein [Klebsiella pneumoniae]